MLVVIQRNLRDNKACRLIPLAQPRLGAAHEPRQIGIVPEIDADGTQTQFPITLLEALLLLALSPLSLIIAQATRAQALEQAAIPIPTPRTKHLHIR